MSHDLTLAVVISTHNRHDHLALLLGDLAQQTMGRETFEILVVDSAEAEDSSGVVDQAAAQGLPARHLLATNILSAKRNRGAEETTAEFLVFLDDDLRVGPDFLSEHLKAHEGSVRRVVSGGVVFPEEWLAESTYYRYKAGRHMNHATGELTSVPPHRVVAMNLSIRRVEYLAMGGFDPEFRRYGAEDLDFGFRAFKAGFELVFSPGAEAIHWEDGMTPSRYFEKVAQAAEFGVSLLLTKHVEARQVLTLRLSSGVGETGLSRVVPRILQAVARPGMMAATCRFLDRIDSSPTRSLTAVYNAMTLLANAQGAARARRGRPEGLRC